MEQLKLECLLNFHEPYTTTPLLKEVTPGKILIWIFAQGMQKNSDGSCSLFLLRVHLVFVTTYY